jgi:hypothetical protein
MVREWLLMTGLVLGSVGALGYLWCKFVDVEVKFEEEEDDDWWV